MQVSLRSIGISSDIALMHALLFTNYPLYHNNSFFQANSHSSFGGFLDFNPEEYEEYYTAPTRPPRPHRPTRATFIRPSHHSHDQPDPPPHSTVIYRPQPTHYPPRPDKPRPTLYPLHQSRPPVQQTTSFYPPYHPAENEIQGQLNSPSMLPYIS